MRERLVVIIPVFVILIMVVLYQQVVSDITTDAAYSRLVRSNLHVKVPFRVDDEVQEVLTKDLRRLKDKARSLMSQLGGGGSAQTQSVSTSARAECSSRKHLHVVGPGVGSRTNQLITLAHALAVTSTFDGGKGNGKYTLLMPRYMQRVLGHFNQTLLQELYCIKPASAWTDADRITLETQLAHTRKELDRRESGPTATNAAARLAKYLFGGMLDGTATPATGRAQRTNVKLRFGSQREAGSTAGPYVEGDLFITSRDLFLWGGNIYDGMSAQQMKDMAAESRAQLLAIGGGGGGGEMNNEQQRERESSSLFRVVGETGPVGAGVKGADMLHQLVRQGQGQEGLVVQQVPRDSSSTAVMLHKPTFAKHVACVFAALWSSPQPPVRNLAAAVIRGPLTPSHSHSKSGKKTGSGSSGGLHGDYFNYHAAHRRSFEGTCDRGYQQQPVSEVIVAPGGQQPHHPLCSMHPAFVRSMLASQPTATAIDNNKNYTLRAQSAAAAAATAATAVFLASDQQEDDSEWLRDSAYATKGGVEAAVVVGWAAHVQLGVLPPTDNHMYPTEAADIAASADVLVSMLGRGMFLPQPRSTYSWMILVLRACLGLNSVKLGQSYDVYYRPQGRKKGGGWLTASDMAAAAAGR
jgi:hypothetical protein